MGKKRSTGLKTGKKGTGFLEYQISKLTKGIIFTTFLNFIIGFMMKDAFDPVAIIGMFFLAEHLFVCTIITNHNYKNIVYLNNEVKKLKKELQRLKKGKKSNKDS